MSTFEIYLIAGIIAIAVGFLLYYFSNLSMYAHQKEIRKTIKEDFQIKDLATTIKEEIENLKSSSKQAQDVSTKLLEIFNREIEHRIDNARKEIIKKYENELAQKAKSEEIAWEKYKKVLSEKRQIDAVIHSIAEGLIVVDATGKVIMMNPAAEKLLGISKKDKVGKSIFEDLKEEQLIALTKHISDKEDKEIELVSTNDETKRILRASTAVIENEEGKTVGMVSVLSDITKQKELDELKSKFVASVSHELRTPLIATEKSLSLFINEVKNQLSPAQKELLEIAQRNIKKLTLLVNDILDFLKLEARKMELKKELVDIEKIIDVVMATFSVWARTKNISLEKKISPNFPKINADPVRIEQVLNNLVGNSLKFTPNNGTITIEGTYQKNKNFVQISVQDSGIGIPKEELPKLFQKFYQVSDGNSSVGGTGLGLTIAKDIVELHGGSIWVESQIQKGSKFTFTLPL
ncbi:MAG: cell wall metabolism sensor histidine kinase WalK [Candidatus Omnitrophica bacterium]|nr:cell wall metabolism sensor histidine kinase WalK [Candidatus Omnitrophota bacterium]